MHVCILLSCEDWDSTLNGQQLLGTLALHRGRFLALDYSQSLFEYQLLTSICSCISQLLGPLYQLVLSLSIHSSVII